MSFLETIWLLTRKPWKILTDVPRLSDTAIADFNHGRAEDDPHSDRLKWEWPLQDLGGSD